MYVGIGHDFINVLCHNCGIDAQLLYAGFVSFKDCLDLYVNAVVCADVISFGGEDFISASSNHAKS